MIDYREALQPFLKLAVKSVAKTTGPGQDALLGFVRSGRCTWTLPEWKIVLRELDLCNRTVQEWLDKPDAEEDWLS